MDKNIEVFSMNEAFGDMEALQRMQEVMRRKPVMLGRVNGVAADVLLRLPDMV